VLTYAETIAYLDGLLKFGIKFGLDRVRALCEAFDNPHERLRVLHIGGTNGKGSTATFVSSILRQAGYRTGLYLSPYVRDLRERIQIDGRMISQRDFAAIVSEIRPIAEQIGTSDLGPVTEFEVKTVAAYVYFARREVDFAVLEVGMGGRFDATNLVTPLVSVITNVSLDHTDRLGNTVEQIAFEKAGIVKTGGVLVTAVDDEKAWKVLSDRCREQGAEIWLVTNGADRPLSRPSPDVQVKYSVEDGYLSVRSADFCLKKVRPGLRGEFQFVNAATAVAAILAMRKYEVTLPARAFERGIARAHIPGRLEVLRSRPTVVIDAAHNPAAARCLARSIRESFVFDRLILVLGMTAGHSCEGVVRELVPAASAVIATQPTWFKAADAKEIAREAIKLNPNVEVIERVPEAVRCALAQARDSDLVLVTGSFYTIGEVNL